MPSTNISPPAADSRARSTVDLGVPTPPEPFQGQTFGSKDPAPDRRAAQGQGTRLPSPGATIRVPF